MLLRLASIVAVTIAARLGAAEPVRPGWWRDATFYEIFVRSFADAQTGPLAGDGVGDLQGLIEHLDYLNDGRGAAGTSLGVDALWLMPIQPSPSYHGYDVTDYFAVNPQFGDAALMKRFVAEAHRRGIRVIIDLVLNHASARHPTFLRALEGDAAARRQFRFAPDPEEAGGPWGGRAWHPSRDGYYYGVFSAEMPDWNFREPAVTQHHYAAADFWLREIGVDGFRLDAVRYLFERGEELQDTEETRAWLRGFTAHCHAVAPGSFVIGENTADMREVARGIRGGSLDSSFEFDLARTTIEAVRLQSPALLTQAVRRLDELYAGDHPWATFLSNHDQDRIRSQLGDSEARNRLAAALLFTLPGVPFLYYGEELGLRGTKPDPELRTPMPWTAEAPNAGFTAPAVRPWHALSPDFAERNVARAVGDADSLRAFYQRLIRLRADAPALRRGADLAVTTDDRRVYAALRATDDDAVLVLANFSSAAVPGPRLALAGSPIRGDWRLQQPLGELKLAAAEFDARGGFAGWRPLTALAPESVCLLRWTKR